MIETRHEANDRIIHNCQLFLEHSVLESAPLALLAFGESILPVIDLYEADKPIVSHQVEQRHAAHRLLLATLPYLTLRWKILVKRLIFGKLDQILLQFEHNVPLTEPLQSPGVVVDGDVAVKLER